VGCSGSIDAAIEEDLSRIRIGNPGNSFAEEALSLSQLPVLQSLARFPQQDVVRVAARLFGQSQEPETRARAILALSLLPEAGGANPAFEQETLTLVRTAISDSSPVVRMVACGALGRMTTGSDADRSLLQGAVQREQDASVLRAGYRTLVKWADWAPLQAALDRRSSGTSDKARGEAWHRHAGVIVYVCGGIQGPLPENIEPLVLELIESDPQLFEECRLFLLGRRAAHLLPQLRQIYRRFPVGTHKALLGATMFCLEVNSGSALEDLTPMQEALVKDYIAARDKHAAMMNIDDFCLTVTMTGRGASYDKLVVQLWKGFGGLPPGARGDLLVLVLIKLGPLEEGPLALLSDIPDSQMLDMITNSESLRKWLGDLVLSGNSSAILMRQGSPKRLEVEQRVRRLLQTVH
jgi:hypothetical protein